MSECPGSTLEAFIDDELSITKGDGSVTEIKKMILNNGFETNTLVLPPAIYAAIIYVLEPYRKDVENALDAYDDEGSWRMYSPTVSERIPEGIYDSISNLYLLPYRNSFTFDALVIEEVSESNPNPDTLPLTHKVIEITTTGRSVSEAHDKALKKLREEYQDSYLLDLSVNKKVKTDVYLDILKHRADSVAYRLKQVIAEVSEYFQNNPRNTVDMVTLYMVEATATIKTLNQLYNQLDR